MDGVIGYGRAMTAKERKQRMWTRRKARGEPIHTVADRRAEHGRRIRRRNERPFVGCDGEGSGTDEHGRQHYMLLRIGDRELYTGKPLTTAQCLNFICDSPPTGEAVLVGFSFGYDITQILRDLPGERSTPEIASRRERLFQQRDFGAGKSAYVYWDDFAIEYLPRNYIRVARTKRVRRTNHETGESYYTRAIVSSSSRTIYEVFGFFQSSFVAALNAFEVGTPDQREVIVQNKSRRGEVSIDQRERDYCALECELLSAMMAKFRDLCLNVRTDRLPQGLRPVIWAGAGKLASSLHKAYETVTAAALAGHPDLPPVLEYASAAYYGGRFEITRTGEVQGPVYEYDINSAYPAAMLSLPCLEHGRWTEETPQTLSSLPPDALWVAPVRFHHNPPPVGHANLCGLPVRKKDGRLFWPIAGAGTYWSVEIEAARSLGCVAQPIRKGWLYHKKCDCAPFAWVADLYTYRKSLPPLQGVPMKLAINSLYGKLAQRIGNPKYANLIWAGLITAKTRAALMTAAAHNPSAIVMLATDGLLSRAPLPLACGDALGQWDFKIRDRVFVVQPGLYWGHSGSQRKLRTRGASVRFFDDKTDLFETTWRQYCEMDRSALSFGTVKPPSVMLNTELFVGLKLAQARGKPLTAGRWNQSTRQFSFDWSAKRGRHIWETDTCCWTYPPAGVDYASRPHQADKERLDVLDLDRAELDDQRDYFDTSPPGFA